MALLLPLSLLFKRDLQASAAAYPVIVKAPLRYLLTVYDSD
jgi:hypothetical protein